MRCVGVGGDAVGDLHVAVDPFRQTAVATPVVEPDVWDERGASVAVQLQPRGEIRIHPHGRSPTRAVAIAEGGPELAHGDAAVAQPAVLQHDMVIAVGSVLAGNDRSRTY